MVLLILAYRCAGIPAFDGALLGAVDGVLLGAFDGALVGAFDGVDGALSHVCYLQCCQRPMLHTLHPAPPPFTLAGHP